MPLHIKTAPAKAIAAGLGLLILPIAFAQSGSRSIDTAHSVITVRVFKAGLFSAFGHNHEIAAPIAKGSVDIQEQRVSLHVDATKLRVLDREVAASTRAEIQQTMAGPEVLDSRRFREISFTSTSVGAAGEQRWIVDGNLTLHGQTKPVRVEVSSRNGHYRGSATIKQSDFGIKLVSVAGGTVKVKDEVKIEFDIVLGDKSENRFALSPVRSGTVAW